MAFQFTNAVLSSLPVSQTSRVFTYPGASPSLSSNGSANGIVWTVEHTSPSVLHAYLAANLATQLYNSHQAAGGCDYFGSAAHFATPTIVNGKVYVGTTNGVAAFGLLK